MEQVSPEVIVILSGVGVIAAMIAYGFYKKPRGKKMTTKAEYILSRREQKQQENNIVADVVGDGLLKLFASGKLTEDRYRYWYMRFGTQLGLKDLLPQKLSPEMVKKAAKARLNNKLFYKPVPFPKEEKTPRPKNIVDQLLNHSK